jgi:cytochrome c biogenesis protein CcmG, thiol:disulfide interchange protein DsbE
MNRFVLPLVAFAALILVLAVGVRRAPDKSVIQSALLGKAAPTFSLPVLGSPDGRRFAVASLRGRWMMLNVWGTWCAECRSEHATLLRIKASGKVPIVGMDWKDQPGDAQSWLQQLGDPYTVVVEDRDGRVAIDYGVYGAPETFLIDPRGKIVYRHVGAITDEVWAQKFLARIDSSGTRP